MNRDHSQLHHQHRQEESLTAQTSHLHETENGKVFNSVEELLRYDASQNPAPESLALRVNASVSQEPKSSWWQRLFSRDNDK